MASIKIKSADFNEYLATMEESGTVETKIVKRGGKGRDTLYVFLLTSQKTDISRTNVSNVSNVSSVSNVSNVEEIPAENVRGKKSTLDTLATLDTKATVNSSAAGRSALDMPIRGRKSAEVEP